MKPLAWSHDRKRFYKYMTATTVMAVWEIALCARALPKLFNDPFDVQFDLQVKYDRDRVEVSRLLALPWISR